MKKIKIISFILLALVIDLNSVISYGQTAVGLGGVANDALGPIVFLRYLLDAASFIVGAAILLSAFFRYLRHRQNPQEAPLSTVIFWAILGLILIAIPLLHYLSVAAATDTGAGDVVT